MSKSTSQSNLYQDNQSGAFDCSQFLDKQIVHVNEFIDRKVAAKAHKRWLLEKKQNMDTNDQAIGSVVSAAYFSADMLRKLLDNNQGCAGVRIYYCKSKGYVNGENGKEYRDVFLMPTGADGKDLFQMLDVINDPQEQGQAIEHKAGVPSILTDGILNASMPCPDHCNTAFMI